MPALVRDDFMEAHGDTDTISKFAKQVMLYKPKTLKRHSCYIIFEW